MSTLHRPAADYGLSLILGGAEGTLWDLVGMYRTLGHAASHEPEVEMPAVHWLANTAVPAPQRVDPGAAWLTLEALLEVNRPGIHGAWRSFDSSRRIAWKTGTSRGFRDGWAIGVSPDWVVGVWVGNADGEGRPELTGFSAAAPVLFDLFDLVDTGGWFDEPTAQTVPVELCAHSGMRAGPDCAETVTTSVPHAGLRASSCGSCQRIHVHDGERVHAACSEHMEAVSWFSLPPAEEWFYQRRHSDYRSLPEWAPGCTPPQEDRPPLSCVSPREGSSIDVPVELDGSRGRVVFEAAHREPEATIHWHLNENYVASTSSLHQISLSPLPGNHRLTLVDEDGAQTSRSFTVME
jgi:penicillin-binding protein 1C